MPTLTVNLSGKAVKIAGGFTETLNSKFEEINAVYNTTQLTGVPRINHQIFIAISNGDKSCKGTGTVTCPGDQRPSSAYIQKFSLTQSAKDQKGQELMTAMAEREQERR